MDRVYLKSLSQVIDIHSIFGQWDIDYIIHGDDPCIVDGKNVYETAIEIGKFREIPRLSDDDPSPTYLSAYTLGNTHTHMRTHTHTHTHVHMHTHTCV